MAKSGWVILGVLIILSLLMGYMLINTIKNNYGEYESLQPKSYDSSGGINITSYNTKEIQFYNNMRFNHNEISYRLNPQCSFEQAGRFASAAEYLDDRIQQLTIIQVPWSYDKEVDIDVLCGKEYLESPDVFVAGEGGPKFVLNGTLFTTIIGGKVVIYRDSCSYNVELHELLHVFGFTHSNNKQSVMYNSSYCNQFLTGDIIRELQRIYSYEPLSDLYFQKIDVVKHGIYLDFNASVKNQGIINSPNITLALYGEGKFVQNFDLGSTDFGGGRIMNARNIKLPTRDIINVTFIIDPQGTIKEYSKENNVINLELK